MTIIADPSTFPSLFDRDHEPTDDTAQPTAGTATVERTAGEDAPVTHAATTDGTPAVDGVTVDGTTTDGTTTDGTTTDGTTTDSTTVDKQQPATDEAATVIADEVDFASLGIPPRLVRLLARDGITAPFEIQAATIPDVLAGHDVLGRGQTGSGKTLAFGLPLLTRLSTTGRPESGHPRALVLVPTRELAMQVADVLRPLAKAVDVSLATAVGGVPYDRQVDALRRGTHLMVATPGRLGDLIERGVCSLDRIQITVLDEADQMADMGFLPDVTALMKLTPAKGQRLMFSATLDSDVDTLVRRFLTNPIVHSTEPAVATVSTMDHHLLLIPPTDKFKVAASIAARSGRTIMFARTQAGVDRLAGQLAAVGVRAGALHGGKTQRVRTRTLAEFREGRMNVLVATDVAARGIHVDGVSLVVHVDPPKDPKDYLHRAGRTARAGESGAVATLVLPKQRKPTLAMMEKAGVAPAQTRVRVGEAALAELTGAREPSGVPVVEEPAPVRRSNGRRGDGDGGRGGYRGERRGSGDRGPRSESWGDRRGDGRGPRGDSLGERRTDRGGVRSDARGDRRGAPTRTEGRPYRRASAPIAH